MAYDPLNQLTIAELDSASRLLKTDIVTAIHGATMHRWAGMGIVAFLLAKRSDPAAQLTTYRAMTPAELMGVLGYPGDDDPAEPDTEPEPAEPEPEPEPVEPVGWLPEPAAGPALDQLAERAKSDPTAHTRA